MGTYGGDPLELLQLTQKVEQQVGRGPHLPNEPRTLDIDILFWGQRQVELGHLRIPHPGALSRSFTLAPLSLLDPSFVPPGQSLSLLELNRAHSGSLKAIMGIFNLTPDSFSDGGAYRDQEKLRQELLRAIDSGVSVIDLGGESTRPGATPLTADQEWVRLEPALALLKEVCSGPTCRPWVSLDTRHPETLRRAGEYILDLANDVTGLSSRVYVEEIQRLGISAIAMHSLSVPADPKRHLPLSNPSWQQILLWTEEKIRTLEDWGLTKDRVFLDPGIGFGKTALQSLELIRHLDSLEKFNMPLLLGHSRKSFLKLFTESPAAEREAETLGLSMAINGKPVEILRVHDYESHLRAQLAYHAVNG